MEELEFRQLNIERDTLIIAAGKDYCLGDDQKFLRPFLYGPKSSIKLNSIKRFNLTAWQGENGIWSKYKEDINIGYECKAWEITALVGGFAGRVLCNLYRSNSPNDCVALVGNMGRTYSPIFFSSTSADPKIAAEILWEAADLGEQLAKSMKKDKEVKHLGHIITEAQNK
jgi:hypothetical protein